MKKAMILHNSGAGEGETSKRKLIKEIESAGFDCSYSSTKQFRWENVEAEELDFFILAGGDGTVRKIADVLLGRKVLERKLPLALLPLGTANNIAKTLELCEAREDIIRGWHNDNTKKFDVGKIEGLGKKPAFFLESFGYGLFPKLMQQMKKLEKHSVGDPKEELQVALKVLHEVIMKAPAKKCVIQINKRDFSGEFLLAEVMNIRSIGPNLNLAPDADPGDGEFDVVLITEQQRSLLAEYVKRKLDGKEVLFDFPILKAKELTIFWNGKHLHVDDEYHRLSAPVEIKIELRRGLLEFLAPVPCRNG